MSEPPLSPTPTVSASSGTGFEFHGSPLHEGLPQDSPLWEGSPVPSTTKDSTPTPRPGYALRAIARLGRFVREISNSKREVLQYDMEKQCLSEWKWPMDPLTKELISPGGLRNHCRTYAILGPCCLCPLKDRKNPTFTEASFSVMNGDHLGEPIASCARDICGYVVLLTPIYDHLRFGDAFLLRLPATLNSAGTSAGTSSRLSESNKVLVGKRGLKRTYAMLDLEAQDVSTFTISQTHAPDHTPIFESELLSKLDDFVQPGLYDQEFRSLLARMTRCTCGMIMLQSVYGQHRCSKALLRPIKRARLNN